MKKLATTYPKIKNIYPILLWKKCDFCNNKFIREKGFLIEDMKAVQSNMSYPTFEFYCCNGCADTKKDVETLITKRKAAFKKPPSGRPPRLKNSSRSTK